MQNWQSWLCKLYFLPINYHLEEISPNLTALFVNIESLFSAWVSQKTKMTLPWAIKYSRFDNILLLQKSIIISWHTSTYQIILIKTITVETFPFTNFASFDSSSFILRLTLSINYLCLPISYKKQTIFPIGITMFFFEKRLTRFRRLYKPRDWYYFSQWIYFFTA